MGYTHYYEMEKPDKDGFQEALPILKKILERHKDIICSEDDQEDKEPELTETSIRFNGKGDNAHETFIVDSESPKWSFCKTARKPYDLPVCEILLVLKKHMKGFKVSSDGFCGRLEQSQAILDNPETPNSEMLEAEWAQAIENVKKYGINYDVRISEERDPYCDLELVLKD